MFISQKLRKTSIAEYLLYMWQVEDIIRAYNCSLTDIRRSYISQFGTLTDEQKAEMTDWYGDIINMINQEGCRQSGHIQINKLVLMQLIELHNRLLNSTKFPFYRSEYYRVLPYIVELRKRGMNNDENEIETCFNALYGKMMLRLQKKEISKETESAINEISTLIGMLADYYHKDKIKPLFDEEEE